MVHTSPILAALLSDLDHLSLEAMKAMIRTQHKQISPRTSEDACRSSRSQTKPGTQPSACAVRVAQTEVPGSNFHLQEHRRLYGLEPTALFLGAKAIGVTAGTAAPTTSKMELAFVPR